MPTERGVIKLTIGGTNYVDFSDIAPGNWATADQVYSGKYFVDSSGNCIPGTGGWLQVKRVSADTQDVTVQPDEGRVLSTVIVNAIKAEAKDNIIPNDNEQTIEPSEDYDFLSKVVIDPVPTTVENATPSLTEQTITRQPGKYISEVIIAPILTEEATVQSAIGADATEEVITPTKGKYFSQVTIQPITGIVAEITPDQDSHTLSSEAGKYYSEIKVAAIQAEECKLNPLETGIWEATPEEGQYYTKVTITKIPRYSGKMEVR